MQTKEVFEPFKDWTSTDFLKGYYEVLPNDEGIACTLLPPDEQGERRIYKVDGGHGVLRQEPLTSTTRTTPSSYRGSSRACLGCQISFASKESRSPRCASGSSMS